MTTMDVDDVRESDTPGEALEHAAHDLLDGLTPFDIVRIRLTGRLTPLRRRKLSLILSSSGEFTAAAAGSTSFVGSDALDPQDEEVDLKHLLDAATARAESKHVALGSSPVWARVCSLLSPLADAQARLLAAEQSRCRAVEMRRGRASLVRFACYDLSAVEPPRPTTSEPSTMDASQKLLTHLASFVAQQRELLIDAAMDECATALGHLTEALRAEALEQTSARAKRAAAWCAEAFDGLRRDGTLLLEKRLAELLGSLLRFHLHAVFDLPSRSSLRAAEKGEAARELLASNANAGGRGAALRFYVPRGPERPKRAAPAPAPPPASAREVPARVASNGAAAPKRKRMRSAPLQASAPAPVAAPPPAAAATTTATTADVLLRVKRSHHKHTKAGNGYGDPMWLGVPAGEPPNFIPDALKAMLAASPSSPRAASSPRGGSSPKGGGSSRRTPAASPPKRGFSTTTPMTETTAAPMSAAMTPTAAAPATGGTTEPAPELAPEPVQQPAAEAVPERMPEPGPEFAPEPALESPLQLELDLAPDFASELAPDPMLQLELELAPELAPETAPKPVFEPPLAPELVFEPALAPQPAPELVAEPAPEPVTEPVAEPAPVPVAEPVTEPVTVAEPLLEPAMVAVTEATGGEESRGDPWSMQGGDACAAQTDEQLEGAPIEMVAAPPDPGAAHSEQASMSLSAEGFTHAATEGPCSTNSRESDAAGSGSAATAEDDPLGNGVGYHAHAPPSAHVASHLADDKSLLADIFGDCDGDGDGLCVPGASPFELGKERDDVDRNSFGEGDACSIDAELTASSSAVSSSGASGSAADASAAGGSPADASAAGSDGATSNGAASDGATSDGAIRDGATSGVAANDSRSNTAVLRAELSQLELLELPLSGEWSSALCPGEWGTVRACFLPLEPARVFAVVRFLLSW